ncbi:MAG: ATP-binding protein [Acidimicrobiales bacterium]
MTSPCRSPSCSTELLQNAIEHAPSGGGSVDVTLSGSARELEVRVVDTGRGVPDGFAFDRDARLGLTIVRTFVVHDLGSSISISAPAASRPMEPSSTCVCRAV